jgi:hypothetical protein
MSATYVPPASSMSNVLNSPSDAFITGKALKKVDDNSNPGLVADNAPLAGLTRMKHFVPTSADKTA